MALRRAPRRDPQPQFAGWLDHQVAGSQLLWLRVEGEPHWLTGGRPTDEDPSKVILVRTGVSFAFRLAVRQPSGAEHELVGVFSWVGRGLDGPGAKQRVWFDLDGDLDALGEDGVLRQRIYDAP